MQMHIHIQTHTGMCIGDWLELDAKTHDVPPLLGSIKVKNSCKKILVRLLYIKIFNFFTQ